MKFKTYLVVYDISSDALRRQTIKILERFGLDRIQYSVFFGEIFTADYSFFLQQLSELKLEASDSILVFPMHQTALKETFAFGEKSQDFSRLFPREFFI